MSIAAIAAALFAASLPIARLRHGALLATAGGSRAHTPRGAAGPRLLAAEVAVSLALLSTALLTLASLRAALAVDTGIDAARVTTVRLSLPSSRYGTPDAVDAFVRRLLASLESHPALAAAGATNVLPLSGMNVRTDFEIVGSPSRSAAEVPGAQNRWVTPGYFEAAGVPILRGRGFTVRDMRGAARVVIVDDTLARQFWAGRDPIGEQIVMGGFAPGQAWTIVGISGSVKHQSVDEPPTGTLYAPMAQTPAGAIAFLANGLSVAARGRAEGSDAGRAVTAAIRAEDPALPVSPPRPLSDLVDAAVAPRRLAAWLASALAATALCIGVFGIAAVTAAIVNDRRREFAIRLAVGASPARVGREVLAGVATVTLAGTVAGTAGAWVLQGAFQSVFLVPSAARPLSAALGALIVMAAAAAGAAAPAWQASRVNATDVLREE